MIMLSIIIIIMETEFCHLTLLTKKGKNHVLTAEELKNGWLFSDTNTPPLSEIVTVPPPTPVIRTTTGVKEGTTFGPQLFGIPGGSNYRGTVVFYRNKI
jgi:hypothetical protein